MVLPAILGGLATGAAGSAVSGLFGLVNKPKQPKLPSSESFDIDPEEFLSRYSALITPTVQKSYRDLDKWREDAEAYTDELRAKYTNEKTKEEYNKTFGQNLNQYRDLIASGFMSPEEAKDQVNSSAIKAGVRPTDMVQGRTRTGWEDYFNQEAIANRPVNLARGTARASWELLGRAPTKEELAFYTPNNGFTDAESVARRMANTYEGFRRNPGDWAMGLGRYFGGGVEVGYRD